MARFLFSAFFLLLGASCLWSQQLPMFTQYRENHSLINPATLNSDFHVYQYNLSAGVSFRKQWVGLAGIRTPETLTARFEWIFPDFNAFWGVYVMNDRAGPTSMTGAYARGGYIISADPEYSGLAIGLNAGIVQHRIRLDDQAEIPFLDEVSPGSLSSVIPDVGFGLFYYQQLGGRGLGDVFYAGVSSPQTFGFDLVYKELNEEFSLKRISHYYALLGLYKFINDDSFVEPSLWFRFVQGAPISIDANIRFQMSQNLWIGTGYTTNQSAHVEVGVLLGENIGFLNNNFKIGYGLDMSFNKDVGGRFGNSHEINITYTLDTRGY